MRRLAAILLLAAAASVSLAAIGVRGSFAVFTANVTIGGNSITADALRNHLSASPGAAGVASGGVDSLSLDFGTVQTPRAIASVFTVTNPTAQSQTAVLAAAGAPQVASALFAGTGTTTATLAPGGSASVTVTTSPSVAGRGSGTLRLRLSGSSWLYRDYPLTLAALPVAPTAPTAQGLEGGGVALSWTASQTTTGLAGYVVERQAGGGAWTRILSTPQAGTTYTDSSARIGIAYGYRILAVSTDAQPLESLPSTTATATPPPNRPTSVALANGRGQGGAYVNAATAAAVSVSVGLPATSASTDTITVTISSGAASATGTAAGTAGAGTATVTVDASSLADGPVSIAAKATAGGADSPSVQGAAATKDATPPRAVDVQTQNKAGGTAGKPEAGDAIVLTFSEPLVPASVLAGWSGAATGVTVRFAGTTNGANTDTITIWNAANTAQLPLGSLATGADWYGNGGGTFTGSTMSANAGVVTVTLGTQSSGPKTDNNSPAFVWSPSSTPTDAAGNGCSTAAATQSGTVAKNF